MAVVISQWPLECYGFPLWGFIIFFTALTEPDTLETLSSDCSRNAKLQPEVVTRRFLVCGQDLALKEVMWEPLPCTIRRISCFLSTTFPVESGYEWRRVAEMANSPYYLPFNFLMILHGVYKNFMCLHSRTQIIIPYSTSYLPLIYLKYI